jgi:hypothetical protein
MWRSTCNKRLYACAESPLAYTLSGEVHGPPIPRIMHFFAAIVAYNLGVDRRLNV